MQDYNRIKEEHKKLMSLCLHMKELIEKRNQRINVLLRRDVQNNLKKETISHLAEFKEKVDRLIHSPTKTKSLAEEIKRLSIECTKKLVKDE